MKSEWDVQPVFGTYRNRQVVLDSPVDWPDGTRVEVQPAPETTSELPVGEFERLLDEMADIVDAGAGADRAPLSDYAVSRPGIYEDHL